MPINGKNPNRLQEEFYESLRREKEAREEEYRREKKAREEEHRREREAREEEYRREREAREEEHRRARKEMADMRREFRERARERDEQWKRITGEWGSFTNDEGGMVEYEGVAALKDLPEIGGMPVDEVVPSLKLTKKGREYDGYIQCPKAVVLLEFKRRLTRESVQKFLDVQLSGFLRDFSGLLNGHAYYGAVVGATIDPDAEKLARESGLFVIRIPANRRVEVVNNQARILSAKEFAE